MNHTSQRSVLIAPRLSRYFEDYSAFHQTRGNKITHYVGIPLIVTSLLGLLGAVPFGTFGFSPSLYFRADWGTLLIGIAGLRYLYLDWKITLPFSLVMMSLYFLGRALPAQVNWTLFIMGWILQGIGHAVFEKNSPAFLKNLTHLLIGPLWIFSKLVGYSD